MVDGMDFCIQEAPPLGLMWYSHKFKGHSLHYEVGVCIKTGWVVWVNGLFPAGEGPDLQIVRSALIQYLEYGKFYGANDDTMVDTSGWRHLQDTTTLNKGPMHWLRHVMKLSAGTSSAMGACQ